MLLILRPSTAPENSNASVPLLTAAVRMYGPAPGRQERLDLGERAAGSVYAAFAAVAGELNSVPVRPQKPEAVASMYPDHRFGPLLVAGAQVSEEKFVVVPPAPFGSISNVMFGMLGVPGGAAEMFSSVVNTR